MKRFLAFVLLLLGAGLAWVWWTGGALPTLAPVTGEQASPATPGGAAQDTQMGWAQVEEPPAARVAAPALPARPVASPSAHSLAAIYTLPPDVPNCDPGELNPAEKLKVLEYVNEIRARHGLSPVRYAAAFDDETAQAALIIAANNQMTHFPDPAMECYTQAGADGSATSNIAWGGPQEGYGEPLLAPSTADVRNWFIDDGVPDLGHRRWILDPFLSQISYGRVDGPPRGFGQSQVAHGAALKVIFDERPTLSGEIPAFVAYPFGHYPLDLFKLDWYWSFSVLVDGGSPGASRDVDFSQATVRVSSGGQDLRVRDLSFNNQAFGLPNHLQWLVDGARVGESYQILIDGVTVGGRSRSYAYEVTITEPAYSRVESPVQVVGPGAQVVDVRAGQSAAIFADPSMVWPDGFRTSSQQVRSQSRSLSPYLTLFWLDGTIGDQLRIPFPSGEVILRISESRDGERDPTLALSRDLNMPAYRVTQNGQEILVGGPGSFAVYVDTGPEGVGRVRWSYDQGVEMSGQILNDHTLVFEMIKAPAGSQVQVSYGAGQDFLIRVEGDPIQGLAEQLGVPVFPIRGEGERLRVAADAHFALYLWPEQGSLEQVSWRATQGMEIQGLIFNPQTLVLQLQQARSGMIATVDLGGGRTVIIEAVN